MNFVHPVGLYTYMFQVHFQANSDRTQTFNTLEELKETRGKSKLLHYY